MKYEALTEHIIKAFYKVYNVLGYGFLEKVYENALYFELFNQRIKVERQRRIDVFYEGINVGEYYADLIVEDLIILELKAHESIIRQLEFQLINYLKATNFKIGLLLNFGKKPELKRKIFANFRKPSLTNKNL